MSAASSLRGLRGAAAVVGVGVAGIGEAHGFTAMEILAQAAAAAVADAGLTMADIDGVCTASSTATMWSMNVVEYLGIRPRFVDATMLGGSSFLAHIMPAIQAGLAALPRTTRCSSSVNVRTRGISGLEVSR